MERPNPGNVRRPVAPPLKSFSPGSICFQRHGRAWHSIVAARSVIPGRRTAANPESFSI
jgi:hypothetical protein